MALIYKGPNILRQTVEDAYARVSANHAREDVRVTIGFPSVIEGVPATYPPIMLKTPDLDEYTDQRVQKLKEMRRHAGQRPADSKEKRILLEIGEQRNADTIYLDSFFTAMHMFGGGKITRALDWMCIPIYYEGSLAEVLDHELVHYDNGVCTPHRESQILHLKAREILVKMQRAAEISRRGPDEFRIWQEGEGREFLDYLKTTQGSSGQSAAYRQYAALNAAILDVDKRMRTLNIDIGEEIVAYNFGLGRDQFVVWLENRTDSKKPLELYDALGKRIETDGKLQTMKFTRQAIDESYRHDSDMLDVLHDHLDVVS